MDTHARRVCAPLKDGWADFQGGRATLLDLSRLAEQASAALDNSSAPLPRPLGTAVSDLEYAYFTNEPETHLEVARRILGPAMSAHDDPLPVKPTGLPLRDACSPAVVSIRAVPCWVRLRGSQRSQALAT